MARGKGSAYERAFCKRLSLWWTDNQRDDIFWRSAASGGRATTRRKQGKTTHGQCGDITAVDPIGQPLMDLFTMELKKGYPGVDVRDPVMTDKTKAEIMLFIHQAKREKSGRYWMLVHRADFKKEMIYMPAEAAHPFIKRCEDYLIIKARVLCGQRIAAFCSDALFALPPQTLLRELSK